MSAPFANARSAYAALHAALNADPELRADVLGALSNLLSRFNTHIYENRFVVGGVAERIIAATFVAMGHTAKTLGVRVTRTDILVGESSLSVKGSFRPKTRTIRLINVLGDSKDAIWNEPTIFLVSMRGIGYADPALLPNATGRTKDAVMLKCKPLYDLWNANPSLLVEMPIPFSLDDPATSDVSSRIVADESLRYTKKLRPFDTRRPED